VSIISEVEGTSALVSVNVVEKQVAINQKLTTMHVIYTITLLYEFDTVIQSKLLVFET